MVKNGLYLPPPAAHPATVRDLVSNGIQASITEFTVQVLHPKTSLCNLKIVTRQPLRNAGQILTIASIPYAGIREDVCPFISTGENSVSVTVVYISLGGLTTTRLAASIRCGINYMLLQCFSPRVCNYINMRVSPLCSMTQMFWNLWWKIYG